MPKFLIVGLGSIGRRHLRNLTALGFRNFVLVHTKQSTLEEDELSGFPIVEDLDAAFKQLPDIAIVSNPTSLHLETAMACVNAGCHLLIEKPISHTLQGCDELQALVTKKGLVAIVGFQFRFHPGLQQLKTWIAQGAIGPVVSAYARYGEYLPHWHPWEDYRHSYSARADLGGGVILTLCHPLDYLMWLLGNVKTVYALATCAGGLGLDVEDTAEITLAFESGITAQVHLDYVQRPPEHFVEIIGQHGSAICDFLKGTTRLFHADSSAWQEFQLPRDFERNTMFLDELRLIAHPFQGNSYPACSIDEGISVLKLALAAKLSAQTNRMVEV